MVANTLRNIVVVGGSFVGRVSSDMMESSWLGLFLNIANSQRRKNLQRLFLLLIGYVQTDDGLLRKY